MRTSLPASRGSPWTSVAAYAALATLVVALLTTSGVVAAVAGALTIGLLVGSYLLERWARRRTVCSTGSPPSPASSADPRARTAQARQPAEADESRMAKV